MLHVGSGSICRECGKNIRRFFNNSELGVHHQSMTVTQYIGDPCRLRRTRPHFLNKVAGMMTENDKREAYVSLPKRLP